jgi:hypothetical protein
MLQLRSLNPNWPLTYDLCSLSVGSCDEAPPEHADMLLSGRAQRVLSDALDLAGNEVVTPLHLFWAMLSEEQGEWRTFSSNTALTVN